MRWESEEEAGGYGPGPLRRWKPWLGTALRLVEEHLWPLGAGRGPPRHVQLHSPGHQAFLCNETAGGQGGQGRGKRAGSPSCYLFSMFCICKLREVKLARRSVTSSTCRTKVRLCHGCQDRPRCLGSPSQFQSLEGRHSLSSRGCGGFTVTREQGSKCPSGNSQHPMVSECPREKGHEQFQRKWAEALRPTVSYNPQP